MVKRLWLHSEEPLKNHSLKRVALLLCHFKVIGTWLGLVGEGVTRYKECMEQHSISIQLVLSNWGALGVGQHLATLQRPAMVISVQSMLSMSVWVCGPIRTKSDDVTSGWVFWLMQAYSYTPPQATPVRNASNRLEKGLNHSEFHWLG